MQHGEDCLVASLGRRVPCCSPATVFLVQLCSSCEKYSHYFLVAAFTCQHKSCAALCGLWSRDERSIHRQQSMTWTARYIPHGNTCDNARFPMRLRILIGTIHNVANTCKSTKQSNAVRGDERLIHLSVNIRLMMDEGLNYRSMPSLQKQHRLSEQGLRGITRA